LSLKPFCTWQNTAQTHQNQTKHNHALAHTHTPLLYCNVHYQLIEVHFKVNNITSQKVHLYFFKERWCPVSSALLQTSSLHTCFFKSIIWNFTAVLIIFRVQKCFRYFIFSLIMLFPFQTVQTPKENKNIK
jgi:hypothetical protein